MLGGVERNEISFVVRTFLLRKEPVTRNEIFYYKKWINFVIDVNGAYDFQGKFWRYFPNSGGLYDQDRYIMDIWENVKYEFLLAYNDENFIKLLNKR